MIAIIPFTTKATAFKAAETVVSHGIDVNSMKLVILPCENFKKFCAEHKAYYHRDYGEYVIE